MVTIYDLLEVEEDASKEEIEKAYSRLILEFRQDINFDAEKNKENEMIVNRLKLAYEILTDDEKRKKYDYQLAQKRAESLIQNVSVKQEEFREQSDDVSDEKEVSENIAQSSENTESQENTQEAYESSDMLTKDEKNRIKKAAQEEFNQKLKKAKQAEAEYNEAYNKAYNSYMRKMGYKVEEPWTFKRIKRLAIAILVVILICFILWHIPFVKNMLVGLYEDNFFVKGIVDIIKSFFDAISGK